MAASAVPDSLAQFWKIAEIASLDEMKPKRHGILV